jgi:hypothetical protein
MRICQVKPNAWSVSSRETHTEHSGNGSKRCRLPAVTKTASSNRAKKKNETETRLLRKSSHLVVIVCVDQKSAHQKSAYQKSAHQKSAHQKSAHQKSAHQKSAHQKSAYQKSAYQKSAHQKSATKSRPTKSRPTKSRPPKIGQYQID